MQEGLGFPVDDRVVEWPDVLRECCSGSGARLRNGDAYERSPQPGSASLRSLFSGASARGRRPRLEHGVVVIWYRPDLQQAADR